MELEYGNRTDSARTQMEWSTESIVRMRTGQVANLEVGDERRKKWHRTTTWQKLLERLERYVKQAHKELETQERKSTGTIRFYSPVRSYVDGGQNDARDYC